jgi:hypothetical protein
MHDLGNSRKIDRAGLEALRAEILPRRGQPRVFFCAFCAFLRLFRFIFTRKHPEIDFDQGASSYETER